MNDEKAAAPPATPHLDNVAAALNTAASRGLGVVKADEATYR